MIQRADIKTASFDVRRKAKRYHAYERGDHVLTMPYGEDDGSIRAVVFLVGGGVICVHATTGESCPANEFGMVCKHVVAAQRRVEINAKRRQTLRFKRRHGRKSNHKQAA